MNKRIVSMILFTMLLSVCAVCFVGCKKKGNDSVGSSPDGQQPSAESISLNFTSLELIVGESGRITAVYEDNGKSQLQFSSDNENVTEVSDAGLITAKNVGSAKVTATYGSAKAECLVNVTLSDLLPEITVNTEEDSLSLFVGDGFEPDINVRFNNRLFPFAPSIKIADEEIAVVKNGAIVANACGQTTVIVSGTWQGCKLEKEISLSVINPVSILFYNEAERIQVNSVELYTIDSIDGVNYPNLFNYEVVIKEGRERKTDFTITSSSDIVSVDPVNATIKGERAGSGFITVGYEDSFGVSYQKRIEVSVVRPVVKSNKTLILSAYDGVVFDRKADGSLESMSITEYFGADFAVCDCDGATVEEGRIRGIDGSAGITSASIVLYGERYGYIVDVCAYTLILDEKEDFGYFTLDSESVSFGGYYVLAHNIDATGYTHANMRLAGKGPTQYNDMIGLTGTFDGRGYTVSNITIGGINNQGSGLFGIVNKTGVVKNVAFNNVKFLSNVTGSSAIACYVIDSTIENVFISCSTLGKWGNYLFAYKATKASTIKNCIFSYDRDMRKDQTTWAYGSFTGLTDFSGTNSSSETFMVDSYVISKTVMTHTDKNVLCDADGWQYDSAYDGLTKSVFPNARHYATYDDMKAANNDYSTFDVRFWALIDGIPQWKTV